MTHDHQHDHSHAHDHAGHSHAPDNFGWAFAIWAGLNTAFVIAELIFGYAAAELVNKVTATQAWSDIPTCKSQGLDVEYLMLRGIFMPGGVTPDQVAFYVDLFKKVQALPEWKQFTETAAFNQTTMSGKEYADWVAKAEDVHKGLMKDAGFLAK